MKTRFKILDKVWICATTGHSYEAVDAMGKTIYFHDCTLKKYGINKKFEVGDWLNIEMNVNDEKSDFKNIEEAKDDS